MVLKRKPSRRRSAGEEPTPPDPSPNQVPSTPSPILAPTPLNPTNPAPAEDIPLTQPIEQPVEQPKTQETEPFLDDEDENGKGEVLKKIFVYILFGILFFAVVGGIAFLAYQQGVKKGEETSQKTQSQAPTPTLTPTPSPLATDSAKLSDYSIKILNGSGIGGEAGKVKTLLEDGGYTVSSIGNADDSYKKTVIQAKDKVSKAWIEKLKKLLAKSYTLSDTQNLDKGDTDVVVILGSTKPSE